MKKLNWVIVLIGTLSCTLVFASTNQGEKGTTLTQKMLKPLIELQCQSELQQSKLWKASSLFMSETKQNHLQNSVCGCVSDHALDDISTKELVIASVNTSAKDKLIRQAVMNSLSGCAQQALK